jgi:hypothetical protein
MTCILNYRRIQFINTHTVGALNQVLMGGWMDHELWTLNQLQLLLSFELFKWTTECGAFK